MIHFFIIPVFIARLKLPDCQDCQIGLTKTSTFSYLTTFIHRTIEYRIHLHTLYVTNGKKIQNKKQRRYLKQTNFNTQNKQNIIQHYVKSAN